MVRVCARGPLVWQFQIFLLHVFVLCSARSRTLYSTLIQAAIDRICLLTRFVVGRLYLHFFCFRNCYKGAGCYFALGFGLLFISSNGCYVTPIQSEAQSTELPSSLRQLECAMALTSSPFCRSLALQIRWTSRLEAQCHVLACVS